ncbi:MAG: ATP-binding cassette domain-containing protein [Bacteroidaceae bacterium]|nr:ATP-binding cassette domain-containing protein [Bacteroidaceae bacterium]
MERIEITQALPDVFASRTDIKSDVWLNNVVLEKEKLYLVEANSGTGKSSLCSYILGYRRDYQGTFAFDGVDIRTFGISRWTEIRKRHIAMLFQELRLFPELTAMENVEVKNKLTGFQSREQIDRWFEMLGIADKKNAKIGRMSFGQQQRVAMMRCLCQPFDFCFVDEPISHLDDTNSAIMADIMMTEAHRQGAGVIVTSIGKHMKLNYDKTLRL